MMYSMMYIGRAQHIKQKAFEAYNEKLYEILNRNEPCLYTPHTQKELELVLEYLNLQHSSYMDNNKTMG